MPLQRDTWLDLARKLDWTYKFVSEREVFPEELSGTPWLAHDDAWADFAETYRTTFTEYVRNQSAKDLSVLAVREVLSRPRNYDRLDPAWLQLVKFHQGAFAVAEYAAVPAELRMCRFGRDSAWRVMANLGALDEIRHSQIQLLLGHDLLELDDNFDWSHRAYHTNNLVIVATRHLLDDGFVAANAIDIAIQLNFVFETGFTNLQFMALAAMADRADHHLFMKALASIQTDEARHAQLGHPVVRTLIRHGGREYAQYLLDKMWWRSWRIFAIATGTAMDYLVPVESRTSSFREFMDEWVVDQFTKNLEEVGLELPWFWDIFLDELDYAQHSLQLALYSYRPMLWFDEVSPSAADREWLRSKYPAWERTYQPIWDRLEAAWEHQDEPAGVAYTLPALCNLCQLPTVFAHPGNNTACTLRHAGRNYMFCSRPCRWIFEQQAERYNQHRNIVDRVLAGDAPSDLLGILGWMGHGSLEDVGRDLRRRVVPAV